MLRAVLGGVDILLAGRHDLEQLLDHDGRAGRAGAARRSTHFGHEAVVLRDNERDGEAGDRHGDGGHRGGRALAATRTRPRSSTASAPATPRSARCSPPLLAGDTSTRRSTRPRGRAPSSTRSSATPGRGARPTSARGLARDGCCGELAGRRCERLRESRRRRDHAAARPRARASRSARRWRAPGCAVIELTLDDPGALDALARSPTRCPTSGARGGHGARPGQVPEAADAGARFCLARTATREREARARRPGWTRPGRADRHRGRERARRGRHGGQALPRRAARARLSARAARAVPRAAFVPTGGIATTRSAQWLEAGAAAVGLGSDLVPACPTGVDLAGIAARAPAVAAWEGAAMIVDAHVHVFRRAARGRASSTRSCPPEREAPVEELLDRDGRRTASTARCSSRSRPRRVRRRGAARSPASVRAVAIADAAIHGRERGVDPVTALERRREGFPFHGRAHAVAGRPGRAAVREPDAADAAAHGRNRARSVDLPHPRPARTPRAAAGGRARTCGSSSTTSASARTTCGSTSTADRAFDDPFPPGSLDAGAPARRHPNPCT